MKKKKKRITKPCQWLLAAAASPWKYLRRKPRTKEKKKQGRRIEKEEKENVSIKKEEKKDRLVNFSKFNEFTFKLVIILVISLSPHTIMHVIAIEN
jgi:hypothetical protein